MWAFVPRVIILNKSRHREMLAPYHRKQINSSGVDMSCPRANNISPRAEVTFSRKLTITLLPPWNIPQFLSGVSQHSLLAEKDISNGNVAISCVLKPSVSLNKVLATVISAWVKRPVPKGGIPVDIPWL